MAEWANYVLLNDLQLILGLAGGAPVLGVPLKVSLYSARINPPSATSNLADFTLFTDPPDTGFTAQDISVWSAAALVGGKYQSVSNTFVFTNTGGVNWDAALGYIITDNGITRFLGGEEFGAPITVVPGGSLTRQVIFDNVNEY